ncbi:MAG TPA: toxin [Bacteroidales bacterium]|nr:toxin [Bacteroidales bacterium]
MATKKEVESFLNEFKERMKIWDVLFRVDRDCNIQTLADLEIRPVDRKRILENLKTSDYSQGPLRDSLYHGSDMWVFGKVIKGQEVYIKISMGLPGQQVICISFHVAKHKMNYPFKN